MPDILVRRLSSDVKERLKVRARANGRSLEAEAREILEAAAGESETASRSTQPLGERLHALIGRSALRPDEWAAFDQAIAADRKGWKLRKSGFEA